MSCSPKIQIQEDIVHCHVCNRELDLVNAAISPEPGDSIYICFGTIKQKIFVYGKYTGTPYDAVAFVRQYTKAQCEEKACEDEIREFLLERGESEYSRLINCHRGHMECTLLTREMVEKRKRDLVEGRLKNIFPGFNDKRKHFCHDDASRLDFTCQCGEELIQLNSDRYRELVGIDDQGFIADYLPLLLKPR